MRTNKVASGSSQNKTLSRDAQNRLLSLDDFDVWARSRLPRPIYGYIEGGAEECLSRSDNRRVFSELAFRPRVLRDVSDRGQDVELLGESYTGPFGIAPMGILALTAHRGDLEVAQAANAAGILNVLSAFSLIPMEEVLSVAPRSWFQAYLSGRKEEIQTLVNRVGNAGFKTLVLTVDTPVSPNRENNVRTGFSAPLRPSARLFWDGLMRPGWTIGTFLRTCAQGGIPRFENMTANRGEPIFSSSVVRTMTDRDRLTWHHFSEIRKQWTGRLVVKGILSPADAELAKENGADAIILSNHGGRNLDGATSPMRVLSEVVAAVNGMPVMIDGGFRRGTDVLKAIALGANMVLIGRPFNFALTAGGASGVAHAVRLLKQEIDRDLAQLGCAGLAALGPHMLQPTLQSPLTIAR